ncbi:M23 family metallopeptidase [Christensenellaceae bacterium OttesenSCG-928-K19]|nr:M23 family metallopeptidase [Christensenellaceae bacterium OttesenSCG-928-K19]
MKRFISILLIILAGISATACAGSKADEIVASLQASGDDFVVADTYTPEPATPSSAPTEDPDSLTDMPTSSPEEKEEGDDSPTKEQEIYEKLKQTDILKYIPADTYQKNEESRAYEVIAAQPEVAYSLQGQYAEWFNDAVNSLFGQEIQNVSLSIEAPAWRLLAVLAYNYAGEPEKLKEMLYASCNFAIIAEPMESGRYHVTVNASPQKPIDLFYSFSGDEAHPPIMNLFTYAYLATIYDDQMNIRDGIEERELEPLLFPIEHPSDYYYDDTWYASRDGGARRHTGTDINAPEGTSLLACVDGTIKDVGNNEGAGYYIVVEGKDGTQYHYYHMVKAATLPVGATVKKGDVVGFVGDTGNSTANHLHFTIITADGYYLNPYSYLKTAQQETIAAQAG